MEFKDIIDIVMRYGADSQKVLDFISDETNQRKFNRCLSFQNGALTAAAPKTSALITEADRTDKKTKVRIALDGNRLLTKKEWNVGQYRKDEVVGIAVITPCVQFVLGLHQWKKCWSNGREYHIADRHDGAQALQILSGYENTKEVNEVQIYSQDDNALKLCWDYGYKELQWYLPCLLELNAVCANKEEINELLKLVDGTPLDFSAHYWSSTEYFAGAAWCVYFHNGGSFTCGTSFAHMARPVVALEALQLT